MFTIGSFAVIFDSENRILLCHRRDIDAWNLPGGVVESGELPTEAVIRETLEETGLNIEIERLAGIYGKADKDEFVFSFVARVVGGKIGSTDEADECIYFSLDKFPENTLSKHVERVEDAIKHSEVIYREQSGKTTMDLLKDLGLEGQAV